MTDQEECLGTTDVAPDDDEDERPASRMHLVGVRVLTGFPHKLREGRDLEYYDGVVLGERFAENGDVFLQKWANKSDTANRWIFVRTTAKEIECYLRQCVTMYDMLVRDGVAWVVDIDIKTGLHVGVSLAPSHALPLMYLPDATALHKPSLRRFADTADEATAMARPR